MDAAKVCGCGRAHTPAGWLALEFVGVQVVEADAELPEERFELRNCECGSTIAVEVRP